MTPDRATVRWCCRKLAIAARSAERLATRENWDSTIIPTRSECASRSMMLRGIIEVLLVEAKTLDDDRIERDYNLKGETR